jgi:hypothetical protein
LVGNGAASLRCNEWQPFFMIAQRLPPLVPDDFDNRASQHCNATNEHRRDAEGEEDGSGGNESSGDFGAEGQMVGREYRNTDAYQNESAKKDDFLHAYTSTHALFDQIFFPADTR